MLTLWDRVCLALTAVLFCAMGTGCGPDARALQEGKGDAWVRDQTVELYLYYGYTHHDFGGGDLYVSREEGTGTFLSWHGAGWERDMGSQPVSILLRLPGSQASKFWRALADSSALELANRGERGVTSISIHEIIFQAGRRTNRFRIFGTEEFDKDERYRTLYKAIRELGDYAWANRTRQWEPYTLPEDAHRWDGDLFGPAAPDREQEPAGDLHKQ